MTIYRRLHLLRAAMLASPAVLGLVGLIAGVEDRHVPYWLLGLLGWGSILGLAFTTQRCPTCGTLVLKRGWHWDGVRLPRQCRSCGTDFTN